MEDQNARRRELEQEAYGATVDSARRRHALEALAALDAGRGWARGDQDPAAADTGETASPTETAAPDAPGPSGVTGVSRAVRRRRVITVAAIAAAALVVGFVGGSLFGVQRGVSVGNSAAGVPTASGDPAATSRLAAGDPAVEVTPRSVEAAADSLLASPRTSVDSLPTLAAINRSIVASTSHLVSTSAQGERLFVTKGSGGGFCLVTSSNDHDFGGSSGFVHCVSATTFKKSGISLDSAGYTVQWTGGTVQVIVTGSGG